MLPRENPYEVYEKPAMLSDETDEQFYKVERILESKVENGKKLYLVKWVGWPVEHSTWEPQQNVSHLHCFTRQFWNSKDNLKKASRVRVSSGFQKLEKVSPGENPYQKTGEIGHFLYGDKPKAIVQLIKNKEMDGVQHVVEIEWLQREDGFHPKNSSFSLPEVMEFSPRFLLQQLQSMVVLEKS